MLFRLLEEKNNQQSYLAVSPLNCSANLSGKMCLLVDSGVTVMKMINCFPFRLETCPTEGVHDWYCKPCQRLMDEEIIGPTPKGNLLLMLC